VTSLVFSDPTPDTIHVNQTQILGNKQIYHPKIYSFNASLGLAGAPEPVSYAIVPETASNDGQVIIVDTTLQLNVDAVTDFTKTVLASKTWYLNVYGRPQLKEMVLPKETVTFNKTIEMSGECFFFRLLLFESKSMCLICRRSQWAQGLFPYNCQGKCNGRS
jgi:hypothetical protein